MKRIQNSAILLLVADTDPGGNMILLQRIRVKIFDKDTNILANMYFCLLFNYEDEVDLYFCSS